MTSNPGDLGDPYHQLRPEAINLDEAIRTEGRIKAILASPLKIDPFYSFETKTTCISCLKMVSLERGRKDDGYCGCIVEHSTCPECGFKILWVSAPHGHIYTPVLQDSGV